MRKENTMKIKRTVIMAIISAMLAVNTVPTYASEYGEFTDEEETTDTGANETTGTVNESDREKNIQEEPVSDDMSDASQVTAKDLEDLSNETNEADKSSADDNIETAGSPTSEEDKDDDNSPVPDTDTSSGNIDTDTVSKNEDNDDSDAKDNGEVNTDDTDDSGDTENTAEESASESENSVPPVRKTTLFRTARLGSGSIPSSYDARDYGLVTPVKGQVGNTCTIYAMVSSIETALLKSFPSRYSCDTLDISEDQLINEIADSTPDPLGLLGSDSDSRNIRRDGYYLPMILPELATGSTPALNASDTPYYNPVATLKEGYSANIKKLDRNTIKKIILDYGSATTGIKLPQFSPTSGEINRNNTHYYGPESFQHVSGYSAHAITIVGWDDNKPASDFTNGYDETPTIDGGWLVKNSWGNSFGDNGYFWVSYEDYYLNSSGTYDGLVNDIDMVSFEAPDDWNIYQYDGGNSTDTISAVRAANVFTAQANPGGTESLSRIGAFLTSGEYAVKVYKYTDTSTAPWVQGSLLGTTALSVPDKLSGYTSAYFDTPIKLTDGDKFAVCIEKTDGSTFSIWKDAPDTTNNTSVHSGESFLQKNSTSGYIDVTSDNITTPANLRIKAFTLNNSDGSCAPKTLGSVSVQGDTTYTGSEIIPEVVIKDTDGNEINSRYCTIAFSNNINAGTATVTVTPKRDWIKGSTGCTFTIVPKDLSSAAVTPSDTILSYSGEGRTPSVTVKLNGKALTAGTDYTTVYANNVNKGTATITVTGIGNYKGTATSSFTITAANGANTTATYPASVEYTGSQIKPEIKVSYNGIMLKENTDYTVSYGSNTSFGQGTITLTFKGNFEGTVTKKFEITQRSAEHCVISYKTEHDYTGESITPPVTVSYNGEALNKGSDYTISYSDNLDMTDRAKIIITFHNLYDGTVTRYFSIVPPDASGAEIEAIEDDRNRIYTGDEYTPFAPDAVFGYILTKGTDYDVSYRNNVNAGTGYVVYTFKGKFRGKKEMPFTIYPASFTDALIGTVDEQEYTGNAITPKPSLSWNGLPLTEGTDYTLSYSNNTDEGTATITATGKGNFSGTLIREFTIKRATPDNNDPEDDPGKNAPENPDPGEDPNNPSNPSTPDPEEPVITPSGNKADESKKSEEPAVIKKEITATGNGLSAIIIINDKVPYEPNLKKLAQSLNTSISGNGTGISVKSVKVKKPKNGSTTAKIVLKGSSKEEKKAVKSMNKSLKKVHVEIEKVDISKASVNITLNNNGTKVKKVTVNGSKLKKSNYSASISSSEVTITGKGNYTGTYTKTR